MSIREATQAGHAPKSRRKPGVTLTAIPLWLSWFLGAATLVAVIFAATHFSEERAFFQLLERAKPWWLVGATIFQTGTYFAQGAVWLTVTQAARSRLSLAIASKLGIAKLFVDQALPSTGISGTILIANALERSGLTRKLVMAGVAVDLASYYAAYVLSLATALVIAIAQGHASGVIIAISAAFVLFATAMILIILGLSGRREKAIRHGFRRVAWVRKVLKLLEQADPRLVRNPSILLQSIGWQLAIIVLDAATIWVLIRALGSGAPFSGVFASFMVSTLFRTIGILPGGLGVFEAASVLTLKLIGVSVPVALSATLLFRGMSFWLPMFPGLYFSRRMLSHKRMETPAPKQIPVPREAMTAFPARYDHERRRRNE